MVLENYIETETCKEVLKWLGIESNKFVSPGNTGYPDRIFWIPGGKPLLIEFKRPGESASTKQVYVHDQLRKLGYRVEIHDNIGRALRAVIEAVDAAQLSKASRKILARARSRSFVLEARTR